MLYEVLEILKNQSAKFLEDKGEGTDLVLLANGALMDDPNQNALQDKILLSLLNIEEEIVLKNKPNTRVENGITKYKNKAVHLNTYVMFAANRNGYDKSLLALSYILQFFQGKKVFTQTNTPLLADGGKLDHISEFHFTVQLYTPSFEQLNYVWGMMGGKSRPCALYKLSIIKVERNVLKGTGPAITEINGELNHILS
ncbi:DUF4255 domain-containing protein [Luteirhabdus pelagi]|uniref:DUF4255 domain-containing protein n=1 Tax=Luteirhabdus pelagi TaxID=2792783 RepID=UPI0019394E6A|nr:DUF4255 domain-containing protein [Luteirhabdus pelagi]